VIISPNSIKQLIMWEVLYFC